MEKVKSYGGRIAVGNGEDQVLRRSYSRGQRRKSSPAAEAVGKGQDKSPMAEA